MPTTEMRSEISKVLGYVKTQWTTETAVVVFCVSSTTANSQFTLFVVNIVRVK